MATSLIAPTTASAVGSAPSSTASSATVGLDRKTIADNFQSFLQLLTTQLKNQNPLDPLDTNQFTQQLVQFAQVEQQLKSNDQLGQLVKLQQTMQANYALGFVGQQVVVDGSTTALTNGQATWTLSVPKPAAATISILNSNGVPVFNGNYTLVAGNQPFTWNGKDTNGVQQPNGNYTISIVAKDASGQPISIPAEVQATVDSADLTQNPPVLSVAGQNYTIDKVKRIVRSGF